MSVTSSPPTTEIRSSSLGGTSFMTSPALIRQMPSLPRSSSSRKSGSSIGKVRSSFDLAPFMPSAKASASTPGGTLTVFRRMPSRSKTAFSSCSKAMSATTKPSSSRPSSPAASGVD